MKKVIAVIVSLFFIFSSFSLAYARKYNYKHVYRYYRYEYESFKPLIWGTTILLGVKAIKEIIFIPQEIEMKKQEIQLKKELINIEIQRKRKEVEFLYNPPPKWKKTPWGKKFLKKLSEQYFFEE